MTILQRNVTDATNFDKDFTSEDPVLSPIDATIVNAIMQEEFKGFSFVNSDYNYLKLEQEEAAYSTPKPAAPKPVTPILSASKSVDVKSSPTAAVTSTTAVTSTRELSSRESSVDKTSKHSSAASSRSTKSSASDRTPVISDPVTQSTPMMTQASIDSGVVDSTYVTSSSSVAACTADDVSTVTTATATAPHTPATPATPAADIAATLQPQFESEIS